MTYKFDVGDRVTIIPFKDIIPSDLNEVTSTHLYFSGRYFGITSSTIDRMAGAEYTIKRLTTYASLPAYILIDNETHEAIPLFWGEGMMARLYDGDGDADIASSISEDDIDNFLSL